MRVGDLRQRKASPDRGLNDSRSHRPEHQGVFLCRRLQDAYWFADMPRGDATDIWAVHLDGVWLEADVGGGVDVGWALCPQPIPRSDIELRHADRGSGTRYRAPS